MQWGEGLPRLSGKTIVVWTDKQGNVQAECEGKRLQTEAFSQLEYHPLLVQKSSKHWVMKKQNGGQAEITHIKQSSK